jgi:hypothetical protein
MNLMRIPDIRVVEVINNAGMVLVRIKGRQGEIGVFEGIHLKSESRDRHVWGYMRSRNGADSDWICSRCGIHVHVMWGKDPPNNVDTLVNWINCSDFLAILTLHE